MPLFNANILSIRETHVPNNPGDLVYNFPSNVRGVLLQKSTYQRAVAACRAAWPPIFWALRVGFGVSLLISIALVFSTLIVAMTAAEEG